MTPAGIGMDRNLNVVIRGHVRNSFDTNILYTFLKDLKKFFDIDIYIHTWNVKQTSLSWRHLEPDFTPVTESLLKDYFEDLYGLVRHVIIDDENHVDLHGELDGLVANTRTPLLGWKRYVYGQNTILKYLYDTAGPHGCVLNIRFDLFSNSFTFPYDDVLRFVLESYEERHTTNVFMKQGLYCGIDNIVIGSPLTMHALTNYVHRNLDHMISRHPDVSHPEYLFPIANDMLFDRYPENPL